MKLKNLLEVIKFSYGSDYAVEINIGFMKNYRLTKGNISSLMSLYGDKSVKEFVINENKITVRCR